MRSCPFSPARQKANQDPSDGGTKRRSADNDLVRNRIRLTELVNSQLRPQIPQTEIGAVLWAQCRRLRSSSRLRQGSREARATGRLPGALCNDPNMLGYRRIRVSEDKECRLSRFHVCRGTRVRFAAAASIAAV